MCGNIIVPDQTPESVGNGSAFETTPGPTVCGTNGVTYLSLCHLLQDTGKEAVAYAGRCGQEECQGGPVC